MAGKDLIFGIRTCIEAIKAGKDIDRVLIKKGLSGKTYQELFKLINQNKINFQFVPIEKLNRVTGKNHQGIITYISPITFHQIEMLVPAVFEKGEIPLLLLLDGITDIRNFGAIARTALCSGVHTIIIPERRSAQINADAVKTSAGALLEIPVCRTDNLNKTINFLKESGIQIISSSENANIPYYNADMTSPTAIILGSEDLGISESILQLSDQLVKIPVTGNIGSLNVSVASAIMVYEAVRQRSSSDS